MRSMLAFLAADTDIRSALGRLIGAPLSDDDWRFASLGISSGGIGARSAGEHAPAAFVGSFSACRDLCSAIWPAFDPLDLDEGCRFAAAEGALGASTPPVPVSMLSLMLLLRSPCRPRSKPTLSPSFFRILPSPGPAVSTLMPAVHPVLALGSRPPRLPATCTSLHRSLGWLCSAASASLSGTAMPPAGFAERFLIGGVTMPFAVAVEATESFATMPPATLCAPLSVSSLLFLPSWKSLASCSLWGPLTLVAPAPAPIVALIITPSGGGRRPADIWVHRSSSGLAEAWISSLLRTSFLSSASPSVAGVFHGVETRKNSFQNTTSQVAALDATFRPLVLEASGGQVVPSLS